MELASKFQNIFLRIVSTILGIFTGRNKGVKNNKYKKMC